MPAGRLVAQEATSGESAAEAKEIKIMGGVPQDDGKKRVFITRLDATLGSLANCECVQELAHAAVAGPATPHGSPQAPVFVHEPD